MVTAVVGDYVIKGGPSEVAEVLLKGQTPDNPAEVVKAGVGPTQECNQGPTRHSQCGTTNQ